MHLFFDTVWKLHIGEIPEKPILFEHRDQDYTSQYVYDDYYASLKVYNEAIAAIKQNALTVGNPEICPQNMSAVEPGKFYEWIGGYETKEIKDGEIRITAGGHPFLGSKTVAILILPEEKKNTMENRQIFAKIIELRAYQIVVMKDFDPEDDKDIDVLVMITYKNGVQIQMRAGFKTSKARDKAFNSYGEKEAHEFIKSVEQLTN